MSNTSWEVFSPVCGLHFNGNSHQYDYLISLLKAYPSFSYKFFESCVWFHTSFSIRMCGFTTMFSLGVYLVH